MFLHSESTVLAAEARLLDLLLVDQAVTAVEVQGGAPLTVTALQLLALSKAAAAEAAGRSQVDQEQKVAKQALTVSSNIRTRSNRNL